MELRDFVFLFEILKICEKHSQYHIPIAISSVG